MLFKDQDNQRIISAWVIWREPPRLALVGVLAARGPKHDVTGLGADLLRPLLAVERGLVYAADDHNDLSRRRAADAADHPVNVRNLLPPGSLTQSVSGGNKMAYLAGVEPATF
jgi:hypothetical protein